MNVKIFACVLSWSKTIFVACIHSSTIRDKHLSISNAKILPYTMGFKRRPIMYPGRHLKRCSKITLFPRFVLQAIHIIIDACEGGNVLDHIKTHGRYSEAEAAKICRTIATLLTFCHRNDITHRDLRPENIIIKEGTNPPEVKIIDFGMATYVKEGTIRSRLSGGVSVLWKIGSGLCLYGGWGKGVVGEWNQRLDFEFISCERVRIQINFRSIKCLSLPLGVCVDVWEDGGRKKGGGSSLSFERRAL